MDQYGTEMGWYVQEYRKHGYVDALHEVRRSLTTLQAILDELYDEYMATHKTT